MLFTKLQGFGFNYYDGGKDKKELTEDQERLKLVELPSFFKYMSFVFYF